MVKFECFDCKNPVQYPSETGTWIMICENCKQGYRIKNYKNGKSNVSLIPTVKINGNPPQEEYDYAD